MSNWDQSSPLLKRLVLKNQNSSVEDYQAFEAELIRHRFSRLLDHYRPGEMVEYKTITAPTLPAEGEIGFLLDCGHPELFLENILYHLRRSKKLLPPALVPGVLGWMEHHPGLWKMLYRQHPELLRALAATIPTLIWLNRIFQPVMTLAPGTPGYYDTLQGKMHLAPGRTAAYIRSVFDDLNPQQQARMIGILEIDGAWESLEFIAPLVRHRRQPVRQAALTACILKKAGSVYGTLRESLIQYLRTSEDRVNFKWSGLSLPASWKALADVAGFKAQPDILMALIDPDDLADHSPQQLHARFVQPHIQAAILHRSRNTLIYLGLKMPELLWKPEFTDALDPESAIAILRQRMVDAGTSIDQGFINLLEAVRPFLDEADSEIVWQRVVRQWKDLPFTLTDLDLEVLALRIHPNKIKAVWQHSILQESAEALQIFRHVLKTRLDFLKKCYK